MDTSFSLDPSKKASYYRGTIDIQKALDVLFDSDLSDVAVFFLLYFSCEKLAKIIYGVANNKPFSHVFDPKKQKSVNVDELIGALGRIGAQCDKSTVNWIFFERGGKDWEKFLNHYDRRNETKVSKKSKSARMLRNQLVHNIGPSHVEQVKNQAKFLLEQMKKFLSCSDNVEACLRSRANKE